MDYVTVVLVVIAGSLVGFQIISGYRNSRQRTEREENERVAREELERIERETIEKNQREEVARIERQARERITQEEFDREQRMQFEKNERKTIIEGNTVRPPIDLLNSLSDHGRDTEIKFEDSSKRWSWEAFALGLNRDFIDIEIRPEGGHPAYFDIGKNFSCLVGGGIGSGKTTLLHNMICQIALAYPPSEVELLLLDFKEGTEFSIYHRLPHVKILVTGTDISLGLSALHYVEQEIKRRAIEFKKIGAKDFSEHRLSDAPRMPRWLVVMDEFQTLFYDHAIARKVEPLLDNLVRKGRSFGINFVLSTQSLLGVNIAESTLSQLGTRIALRMQERDAARFLSADNTEPASFKMPGTAVYNDNNGFKESNKNVQIFPIGKDYISYVIDKSIRNYPQVSDKHILDGSAFADLQNDATALSEEVNKGKFYSYRIGLPLDLGAPPLAIRFDKNLPERLCVLGNHSEKWLAILRTWVHEFWRGVESPKVSIFDFGGELIRSDLQCGDLDLQILTDLEEIQEKLCEIENRMTMEETTLADLQEMICFYDIGAATSLRRKILDPATGMQIDNPLKAQAIKIINFGPSIKRQITLFGKSALQIDEVFKLEYETPIRLNTFEYQIIVDANELGGYEDQSLSDHNAFVVNSMLGKVQKVILYDIG